MTAWLTFSQAWAQASSSNKMLQRLRMFSSELWSTVFRFSEWKYYQIQWVKILKYSVLFKGQLQYQGCVISSIFLGCLNRVLSSSQVLKLCQFKLSPPSDPPTKQCRWVLQSYEYTINTNERVLLEVYHSGWCVWYGMVWCRMVWSPYYGVVYLIWYGMVWRRLCTAPVSSPPSCHNTIPHASQCNHTMMPHPIPCHTMQHCSQFKCHTTS